MSLDDILGPDRPDTMEIGFDMPDCVKLTSPKDGEDFKAMVAGVVNATNRNALRVLRAMMAETPGAAQLQAEFAGRLGIGDGP